MGSRWRVSDSDALNRAVGQILRDLRVGAGVSQSALAEALMHHQTFVSRLETGEREVSLVDALRWVAALGVSLGELCAAIDPLFTQRIATRSIWESEASDAQ